VRRDLKVGSTIRLKKILFSLIRFKNNLRSSR
jgi:hypothetical protein